MVDESRPLLGFLWASNRVWVAAPHGNAAALVSARVSAGTLGSFVAVPLPGGDPGYVHVVDEYLAVEKAHQLVMARLLANGRLGPSKLVADDLLAKSKEADPKLDAVFVEGSVRVGGRYVWALHGSETVGLNSKEFLLVCCDGSGAAVNLTRFVDRRVGATFPQLGVDARGRLWLGWLDRRDSSGAIRGAPVCSSSIRPHLPRARRRSPHPASWQTRPSSSVPPRCPHRRAELLGRHRLLGAR